MRASRAQIDRALDGRNICGVLERTPRLAVLPRATSGLLVEGPAVCGEVTGIGPVHLDEALTRVLLDSPPRRRPPASR